MFLNASHDFIRDSYDVLRASYEFMNDSCEFIRCSYDVIRSLNYANDGIRGSYDFPIDAYGLFV